MNTMVEFFKDNALVTFLITVAGGIWVITKYMADNSKEKRWREFDTYHKMIKDLVQPEKPEDTMYIDRQCALIYEFRFFPRYYPQTYRMLKFFQNYNGSWEHERIRAELAASIDAIEARQNSISMRLKFRVLAGSFFKV